MIREAHIEESEILAEIISESFADVAIRFSLTPENCPKHPSNCTVSWIESDFKRGVRYFILSRNSNPAGCAGLESPVPDICYLERLAVLPEMRGNHYGVDLVRHTVNCAVSNGVEKLSIGIIDRHTELKEWYKNLGFVETGTRSFPHLPFTVCFMELELNKSKS
jgi:N-acetylglutamate synthase-like GNAT family acetyltransferase